MYVLTRGSVRGAKARWHPVDEWSAAEHRRQNQANEVAAGCATCIASDSFEGHAMQDACRWAHLNAEEVEAKKAKAKAKAANPTATETATAAALP